MAIYNKKGGVGKSTSAVNLAYIASTLGYRTLLWDLDPQQSATRMLTGSDMEAPSLKTLLSGKKRILDAVQENVVPGLSLLPGRFSYRKLATRLRASKSARLDGARSRFQKRFDLLFVDTPPSLDRDAEVALAASDVVLVPVVPSPAAVATLQEVTHFLAGIGVEPDRVLVYSSRVQKQRKTHREIRSALHSNKYTLLESSISEAAELERTTPPGKPVARKSDADKSAREFRMLFREIAARVPF